MLTAYSSIFQGIPYIAAVLVVIAACSLIFQRNSSIARSMLFSFGFWLAPLFYIIYILLVQKITPAIITALLVESFILIIYLPLFSSLLAIVGDTKLLNLPQLTFWLKIGTVIVAALALPLFFVGNFGIFSEGSRNEYLADSKWLLDLTYASFLIQAVMVPVIAAILNRQKRWSKLVVFYLAMVSVLSLLLGSKGGGVLSIIAILSLLRFDGAKDFFKLLRVPLISITVALLSTIYYLGKFLSLDPLQMTSLFFVRVFLNNDARALAIDINGMQNLSLFRESFRSIASLFGSPPNNPALGQYLYAEAFHTTGYVGGNTSSTALLIAYGGLTEKVIFAFLICIIAFLVYISARSGGRHSIVKLAIALILLAQLSQDFLAFQLLGNILILLAIVVIIGIVTQNALLLVGRVSTSVKDVNV